MGMFALLFVYVFPKKEEAWNKFSLVADLWITADHIFDLVKMSK